MSERRWKERIGRLRTRLGGLQGRLRARLAEARAPALPAPEPSWREAAWALILALALTLLSVLYLADFHLGTWPLTASDFQQYCACVEGLRQGMWGMCPLARSPVAGLPAGWLAGQLGIMDGLLAAANLSLWATLAGIWMWARAAGGRTGATLAVIWALAIPSLVSMSRTVSFYPELLAACVLSSACAVWAVRLRTPGAVLVASAAAGLVLLVDVRGLWWGMAAAGLATVAALASRGRWWVRAGALILPLEASWWLGRWLTPFNATSLEEQSLRYAQEMARSSGVPLDGLLLQEKVRDGFLWGHGPPWRVTEAMAMLADIRAALPPGLGVGDEARWRWENWVTPWMLPAMIAGAAALWLLRREPLRLAVLLGGLLPFALLLWSAREGTVHARLIGIALAPLPVILGVGSGALIGEGRRGWIAGIALLALVTGPGPLGPTASWRLPVWADNEPQQTLKLFPRADRNAEYSCMEGLRRDAREGRGPGSRWFLMPGEALEPGLYVPDR